MHFPLKAPILDRECWTILDPILPKMVRNRSPEPQICRESTHPAVKNRVTSIERVKRPVVAVRVEMMRVLLDARALECAPVASKRKGRND